MLRFPRLATAETAIEYAHSLAGHDALQRVVAPELAAQILVTIAWGVESGHFHVPTADSAFRLTMLGADLAEHHAAPAIKSILESFFGVSVFIDLVNPAADGYVGPTGPDRRRLEASPAADVYPMITEAYWRLKNEQGAPAPNMLLAMHPGVVANGDFWTADEGVMQYVRAGLPIVLAAYNEIEATLEGDDFCRHGFDMASIVANPLAEAHVELSADRVGGRAQFAGYFSAIVGVDVDQWQHARSVSALQLIDDEEDRSETRMFMAPSIASEKPLERLAHGTRMLEAVMMGGGANFSQLRRRIARSIDADHQNPYLRAEVAHGLLAGGRGDLFVSYTGGDPAAWNWLNGKGESSVHIAAAYGLSSAVDTAIRVGAKVWAIDDLGYTPWMRAVMNGHTQVAAALIAATPEGLTVSEEDLYAIFAAGGHGGAVTSAAESRRMKVPNILRAVMDGDAAEASSRLIDVAAGDLDELAYSPQDSDALKAMLIQMSRSALSNVYERGAPSLVYWCELAFATLRSVGHIPNEAAWLCMVDLLRRRARILEE